MVNARIFPPQAIAYVYRLASLVHNHPRKLFRVALAFWILYFREAFFRSGKIKMHWLLPGIADFLLMLSIAIVFLVFTVVRGLPTHHRGH